MDCPSGCISSGSRGILFQDRVGWLAIWDYDDFLNMDELVYFDLFPDDEYLFSSEFAAQIDNAFGQTANMYFLVPVLIKDKDTPAIVLSRIVAEVVTKSDHGRSLDILMKNPLVRGSKDILFRIAEMPKEYDLYSNFKKARLEAINLLKAFD